MNPMRLLTMFLLGVTLLVAGCGGGDNGGPVSPQGIGPGGGTVSHASGAQVVVPPNALTQSTDIAVAPSSAGAPAMPSGFTPFGTVYAFTPHGTNFAAPATVTVPFDPTHVPAGAVPALFKTNAQGTWERVSGATFNANAASAQVSSFSWFVVGIGTSVLVDSSTPSTAQGALSFSSVSVVDVDSQSGPRTVATLTGTTASGLPAKLEISFDRGTGANPQVQLNWGNAPESIAYCAPGSSNPCPGVIVSISAQQIDILLSARLDFGGSPSARAEVRGSITLERNVLAPAITQQPASVTVAAGLNATFTAAATGTGLAYQWERSNDGGATFAPVSGATGASYTLVGAQVSDNDARLRVVASNGAGSATSAAATLTVTANAVAPTITADPQDQTVPAGSTVVFTVTAVGTPPLVYEWHKNGANIGTNSSTLSFIVSVADDSARIDVKVMNGSGSVTSAIAILTVTTPTAAPLNPVRIAGGNNFSYARSNGGALYSWGSDLGEALGDGISNPPPPSPTPSRSVPGPVSVIADAIALTQSYGGSGHGLAIRANGEVWGWGGNNVGQLGNNRTTSAGEPTPGPMLDANGAHVTGAVAVSAGGFSSLVLLADGRLLVAGSNTGDGTSGTRSFAAPVPGLSSIVAIATGAGASYALRSDGTVWGWGDNTSGALGDGTEVFRPTPVQVSGLTGIVAIAAGNRFALALDANGDVWSWGLNSRGQLGDGSVVPNRLAPAKASIAGVKSIAAGLEHGLALMTDGTVRAWGSNSNGQLGVGDQTTRLVPVVVPTLSQIVAIAGGNAHSLAVRATGEVMAWGSNVSGALGLGSTVLIFRTPQQVPGLNLN